jgi:hypothetical protein
VHLPINGGHGQQHAVRPPRTNVTMKPMVQRPAREPDRPPYMVNSQLKILTPVGTPDDHARDPKTALTLALAPW